MPALALCLAIVGANTPSSAQPPDGGRATVLALQAADLRVATVAFRLASAGVQDCPLKAGLTGITLHDASQYAPRYRDAARAALGLGDRVGVIAVAPGSPAEAAGLRAGDALLAVGGRALPAGEPGRRARYAGVAAAYMALEAAAAKGPVTLQVERAGASLSLVVVPIPGCASRVQLRPGAAVHAGADGVVLSVTTGLLAYVANDDELALAIAHEMAHNALGHRARLRAAGVRRGLFGNYGSGVAAIRETEAAADRLAYRLMSRGGYDLGVAEGFWRRLYAGPAKGRANAATHRDLDARIADARAAREELERP